MLGDHGKNCRVCVTGAGGYIASWLVKNLLAKGYNVNATFRDPEKESKTRHILSLPGARERLTLFKADITKEGSFDSALSDCDFVVHLATPMDFTVDAEAQASVVEAEVKGTLDILKACATAKSVRRVIYTSSINAASPLNDNGEFRDCVDESCWTPEDLIRREKPLFWMYYVSKTSSEQAALQYGSDHGIEVVTIAPSLVAGPSLTPTLPTSVEETLGMITGSQEGYEWLKEFQWLMGSIALVHIDDLCDAYILLMEHPSAKGRYICSAQHLSLNELSDFCNKRYSQYCPPLQSPNEDAFLKHVPVSSKRLLDLGFSYKYGLPEIFDESIEFGKRIGILQ